MFSGDDKPSDPFGQCETIAEILVVINHLFGLAGVEKLLTEAPGSRESLREAAEEIGRVGLQELAQITRRHARKAKPEKPTFDRRWQTDLRREAGRRGVRGLKELQALLSSEQ